MEFEINCAMNMLLNFNLTNRLYTLCFAKGRRIEKAGNFKKRQNPSGGPMKRD